MTFALSHWLLLASLYRVFNLKTLLKTFAAAQWAKTK
jgi:hypothetical protein